jgi:hypothetical protein
MGLLRIFRRVYATRKLPISACTLPILHDKKKGNKKCKLSVTGRGGP